MKQATEQYRLNAHDRRRLEHAVRQSHDARLVRRAQALLLVADGRSIGTAARLAHCSRRTIQRWLRRYARTRTSEALQDMPRTGRPRLATSLTPSRIRRELHRKPWKVGYNATGWTVTLLASHLRKTFDVAITPRTLRRRMKEMQLRWKRPRYVYMGKELHRAQKRGHCALVEATFQEHGHSHQR